MKIKICGMKYNTEAVADLKPDYLGFIVWEPSARFFDDDIPPIPSKIKKVGVFVDAEPDQIIHHVEKYQLHAVQLHGSETVAYCARLQKDFRTAGQSAELIKAFSVGEEFRFDELESYLDYCDFFLFDTRGELPGGTGKQFNWQLLAGYPFRKPYFLSGGIGAEQLAELLNFTRRPEAEYCHAIDLNSRFETEPGLKNTEALSAFVTKFSAAQVAAQLKQHKK